MKISAEEKWFVVLLFKERLCQMQMLLAKSTNLFDSLYSG